LPNVARFFFGTGSDPHRRNAADPAMGGVERLDRIRIGSGKHAPVCGTKFFTTADREFCPVCILNRAWNDLRNE